MSALNPAVDGPVVARLNKRLTETDFTTIDPILNELGVDTPEGAISELVRLHNLFKSANFYPFAANVAYIISFIGKFENNNYLFVEYALQCMSPMYSRFLTTERQEKLMKHIVELEKVSIVVENSMESPFDFGAGFERDNFSSCADIPLVFRGWARCGPPIIVNSVSVIVKQVLDERRVEVLKDTEFSVTERVRQTVPITVARPGVVEIKAVIVTINQVEIEVREFSEIVSKAVSVRPLDSRYHLTIARPEFGLIGVPLTVSMVCEGIPDGAESFNYSLLLESDNNAATVVGDAVGEVITDVSESIVCTGSNIHKDITICATAVCDARLTMSWSIDHKDATGTRSEAMYIPFCEPFAVTFRLCDPERFQMNFAAPITIGHDGKYVLATALEYKLPVECIVEEFVLEAADFVVIDPITFELPIDLAVEEAFSAACFVTPRARSTASSGSIGRYVVKYKTKGSESPLTYSVDMPIVDVPDQQIEVKVVCGTEIWLNKESSMTTTVTCLSKEGFRGTFAFALAPSDCFAINSFLTKPITLAPDETTDLHISFVPAKAGRRDFPRMSIVDDDSRVAWKSVLPIIVACE